MYYTNRAELDIGSYNHSDYSTDERNWMFDKIDRLDQMDRLNVRKSSLTDNPFEKMILNRRSKKPTIGDGLLGLSRVLIVSKEYLDFFKNFKIDDYKIFQVQTNCRGFKDVLYVLYFVNDACVDIDYENSNIFFNDKIEKNKEVKKNKYIVDSIESFLELSKVHSIVNLSYKKVKLNKRMYGIDIFSMRAIGNIVGVYYSERIKEALMEFNQELVFFKKPYIV